LKNTYYVANKIGTYLKALAANDNHIPFYVALPSTTLDMSIRDGLTEIPIEERDQNEVKYIQGKREDGQIDRVLICPETTPAANYGFDVTPARLVTALITERGVCPANEAGILSLFPEYKEA
jgi:methylthioribose-1-phosphate isomerase